MNVPLKVLLVEDEGIILMQLEMLLEESGHVLVGTAASADEAIALVEETGPDLMLIDLRLSEGSSGIDVARAVRDLQGITVVFLTANTRQLTDDMEGAAAVIAKPFSATTFEYSMSFLEECVHRPPPLQDLPYGMRLAPAYLARLDGLRAAH